MYINYEKLIKENNLPAKGSKVVVAMSGGVDSSVTAVLLHEAGYKVIGVTMQLYQSSKKENSKTCCSGIDIADARKVSQKFGFKHFILDFKSEFKNSVISEFVESYLEGETPIPCIRCNQTVKFRDLIDFTRSLGAEVLATGHYVKRLENKNETAIYQAKDDTKDQSYFLFSTTQEQLKVLRFPLGHFDKVTIRQIAQNFGLNVALKPDSQDICFIPNGNYRDFIEKYSELPNKKGLIKNSAGDLLGYHNGILNYTIGQRKRIGIGGVKGIANQKPLYVIKIDKLSNCITVGFKEELCKFQFQLKDLNLLNKSTFKKSFDAFVKVRSGQKKIAAKVKIYKDKEKLGVVDLLEPEYGIAPGQACVFYNEKQKLLGGGWITS